MGYIWFLLILMFGGLGLAVWGFSSNQKDKRKAREKRDRMLADVPRIVAKDKAIYLPIFVEVLKSEFHDSDNDITEISMSDFYDEITHWRAAYVGDQFSDVHMDYVRGETSMINDQFITFKEVVKTEGVAMLPEPVRPKDDASFDDWYAKMDKIVKFATEKSVAKGYNSRDY